MRVGAILEQEDPLLPAIVGDGLGVEGDVASDVDQDRGAGAVLLSLGLEVGERHAQVLAVAVHELDLGPGPKRRQRRGHERVGRAQNGLALDAGEVQRGQCPTGPAGQGHGRQLVPLGPGRLQARDHRGLRPALRIQHLVDQRVQAGAIAVVEADREPREIWDCPYRRRGSGGHECRRRAGAASGAPLRRPRRDPRAPLAMLSVAVRPGKPVRQAGRYRVPAP